MGFSRALHGPRHPRRVPGVPVGGGPGGRAVLPGRLRLVGGGSQGRDIPLGVVDPPRPRPHGPAPRPPDGPGQPRGVRVLGPHEPSGLRSGRRRPLRPDRRAPRGSLEHLRPFRLGGRERPRELRPVPLRGRPGGRPGVRLRLRGQRHAPPRPADERGLRADVLRHRGPEPAHGGWRVGPVARGGVARLPRRPGLPGRPGDRDVRMGPRGRDHRAGRVRHPQLPGARDLCRPPDGHGPRREEFGGPGRRDRGGPDATASGRGPRPDRHHWGTRDPRRNGVVGQGGRRELHLDRRGGGALRPCGDPLLGDPRHGPHRVARGGRGGERGVRRRGSHRDPHTIDSPGRQRG